MPKSPVIPISPEVAKLRADVAEQATVSAEVRQRLAMTTEQLTTASSLLLDAARKLIELSSGLRALSDAFDGPSEDLPQRVFEAMRKLKG